MNTFFAFWTLQSFGFNPRSVPKRNRSSTLTESEWLVVWFRQFTARFLSNNTWCWLSWISIMKYSHYRQSSRPATLSANRWFVIMTSFPFRTLLDQRDLIVRSGKTRCELVWLDLSLDLNIRTKHALKEMTFNTDMSINSRSIMKHGKWNIKWQESGTAYRWKRRVFLILQIG